MSIVHTYMDLGDDVHELRRSEMLVPCRVSFPSIRCTYVLYVDEVSEREMCFKPACPMFIS